MPVLVPLCFSWREYATRSPGLPSGPLWPVLQKECRASDPPPHIKLYKCQIALETLDFQRLRSIRLPTILDPTKLITGD